MFIAFGLLALYYGQNLAIGTTVRMGPGYVPRMLALIMMGLGAVICVVALVSGAEPVEKPKWKPITLVTIGIICFALLFERAGLLPALIVLVAISSLGGEEFKLTEVIAQHGRAGDRVHHRLQGRSRDEYLHRARSVVRWRSSTISPSASASPSPSRTCSMP